MTMEKYLSRVRAAYQQSKFPFTPNGNRKRLIFIHIPKAAGTAVRVAIGEPEQGRQHLPWWVYQQAAPKKFEHYFKFAFVRNPITRALSGFNYLKSGGNQMDDLKISDYLRRYQSFPEFLEQELLEGRMIYHPVFRPQSWYLCDWQGQVKVDYLGHFESINRDCSEIAKITGIEDLKNLPELNRATTSPTPVDNESRDLIREIYKDDFSIFNY